MRVILLFLFLLATPVFADVQLPSTVAPVQPSSSYAPIVFQTTDYTCGPAAAQSVLNGWGIYQYAEMDLARILGTTSARGTLPPDFIAGLSQIQVSAKLQSNLDLKKMRRLLNRDKGIIAYVQSGTDGHWVNVVDVNLSRGIVTVMDPWPDHEGYPRYSEKEFNAIWWGEVGTRAALILEPTI